MLSLRVPSTHGGTKQDSMYTGTGGREVLLNAGQGLAPKVRCSGREVRQKSAVRQVAAGREYSCARASAAC